MVSLLLTLRFSTSIYCFRYKIWTDNCLPSRNLLFQSQQCKHQNNVWNLFKANNKYTRWTDFTYGSGASIVDLEQVNADELLCCNSQYREAIFERCSVKNVFSKFSQNLQETTCVGVSFWTKWVEYNFEQNFEEPPFLYSTSEQVFLRITSMLFHWTDLTFVN